MRDDSSLFVGGGNVFADLGLPNPDGLLAKANLTAQIQGLLERQGLTDAEAATRMDIPADQVAHLLEGGFDDFTFDQLFHSLNRLGCRVEIHLSPDNAQIEDPILTVIAA